MIFSQPSLTVVNLKVLKSGFESIFTWNLTQTEMTWTCLRLEGSGLRLASSVSMSFFKSIF